MANCKAVQDDDSPLPIVVSLLFISSLVICLHVVAIALLSRLKKELKQITIMINLSFAELLFSFIFALHFVDKLAPIGKWYKHLEFSFIIFCLLATKLFMLFLVVDRFMEVYFNIRYPIIFTKRMSLFVLFIIWVVSGAYVLVNKVLILDNIILRETAFAVDNYISLVIDAIFLVTATYVYCYFYLKVKKITEHSRISEHDRTTYNNIIKFVIPFLMVVTYVIFNITATILCELTCLGIKHRSLGRGKLILRRA